MSLMSGSYNINVLTIVWHPTLTHTEGWAERMLGNSFEYLPYRADGEARVEMLAKRDVYPAATALR